MIFVQEFDRVRAGVRTSRGGDTVPDWSTSTTLLVRNVSVQATSENEATNAHSDTRMTRLRVLSAPGTDVDITALDRVVYLGNTYEVDGDVARWPDPFSGLVHHAEFVIRRDEGG